jgi:hypothetical protein
VTTRGELQHDRPAVTGENSRKAITTPVSITTGTIA